MTNLRSSADPIRPSMTPHAIGASYRRLALAAWASCTSVALLMVLGSSDAHITLDHVGLRARLQPGGTTPYVAFAVFFLGTIRERQWQRVAVGTRAFMVFCLLQGLWSSASLVSTTSRGAWQEQASVGSTATIAAWLIGHFALCLATRRELRLLAVPIPALPESGGPDLPPRLPMLARGAGAGLLALGVVAAAWYVVPVHVGLWAIARQGKGWLVLGLVAFAGWQWNRMLRRQYGLMPEANQAPRFPRPTWWVLATGAILLYGALAWLDHSYLAQLLLRSWHVPMLLTTAYLAHALSRSPHRAEWRLPLVAALAGSMVPIALAVIAGASRSASFGPSDRLIIGTSLVCLILLGATVSRLARADR